MLVLGHDVEMRIEGRDLVDLRHGDPEFFRQRVQMTLGQAAFLVLDEMQVLDQQGALAGPLAEQGFDSCDLAVFENATRGNRRSFTAAGAWVDGARPFPVPMPPIFVDVSFMRGRSMA